MKKPFSVIQRDFDELLETGRYQVHHIFPGYGRRKKCEKYGFLAALSKDAHLFVHYNPNAALDLMLKRDAQRYFERHYGTRDDFIKEFKRSYL